jgi:3-methyladenine DNA glycosylase AlkD/predicted nucleotidyltransferase
MEHAPKTILAIQSFLDQVIHLAAEHVDIQAVVLVGSYARGKATQASDIDLVLLVDEPKNYLAEPGWIDQFGPSVRQQVEEYGRLTSLRAWYEDGTEVEFGLTDPGWAASPLDEGTDRVLMDGVKVLYERKPLLSPVLEGFGEAEDLFTAMVQTIQQRVNAKMASQNVDFQHVWLSSPESKAIFRLHRQEIRWLPLRGRLHLARWLTLSDEIHGTGFANAVLELSAKELDPSDFAYLDEHLNHFRGWGPTDDFCINVLQPLLWKYPGQTLELLQQWNRSENPWKRRASVVVYTRKVGASGKFTRETLELCENLLWDKEDLVQKGVGWALKDGMRGDRTQVLEYVKALRRMGVSAVITLYAIRDLKGAERQKILEIHA